MAGGAVHYEVFVKRHRKASWTLAEARESRQEALALASHLLDNLPKGSVRVTKETYDSDRHAFRSAAIHEAGAERFEAEPEKNGAGGLPCMTPDDLANAAARSTIARVLADWLQRRQTIPLELLHRPDLVEQLEGSGTELQHAVQKVAVASAREGDATVHTYVKQINELIQKGLTRVYQDGRDGRLPRFSPKDSFRTVSERIFAQPSRAYRLRAAMADRLGDAGGYRDKLDVLLAFLDDLPEGGEARDFALAETDAFMAEILGFDGGVRAVIGHCEELGDAVERLANVFDGSATAEALRAAPDAGRRLAEKLKAGLLPDAKSAIAQRLMIELRRPKRLRPNDVAEEVRLARALAQKLVMATGPDLALDALTDAFSQRSARLLTPETIGDYLDSAGDPDDEIARLLDLEDNLVGAQNKKRLAAYVRATLSAHKTESWFARGAGGPVERLAKLRAYQKTVIAGRFPPDDERDLMSAFDALGLKVLTASRLLERVQTGDQPVLDRARALLKLAAGDMLPLGACVADAQARALRLIRSEMGLKEAREPEARERLVEIQQLLATLTPPKPPEPPAPEETEAA